MTFNDTTELLLGFTTDRFRMREVINGLAPGGYTALWDAISRGLDEMKKAKNTHKALVVVTDGEDNRSLTAVKDLIERVKESDVLVYSVAMMEGEQQGLPFWFFNGQAPGVLRALADASGAYAHRPRSVEQCKKDMQRIASGVSHQYIRGYYLEDSSGPPRFRSSG